MEEHTPKGYSIENHKKSPHPPIKADEGINFAIKNYVFNFKSIEFEVIKPI